MAKFVLGGKPSKATLTRVKVGTVVVSVAAFLGSLAGVANSNPAVVAAQTQSSVAATTATDTSSSAATSQQQAMVLPTVRTRGS